MGPPGDTVQQGMKWMLRNPPWPRELQGVCFLGKDLGWDKHRAPCFPSQGSHLCPVLLAEGLDRGVDVAQRLLAGQVQEVEGVVEPSKGLGGKGRW